MQKGNDVILSFNNPLIRFITAQKYRWLRHTLFILVGLTLAFKGDVGVPNDTRSDAVKSAVFIVDTVSFIFILGMLYILLLVLIPKLLFRSKLLLFGISFFILISIIYIN